MAWYDALMEQGAVPAGVKPKVITEPGGKPGFFQTDKLSSMLRGLESLQVEQQKKEEERQKKLSKQVDMYKTLRDAGYAPSRAYDAVKNRRLSVEPGGESIKEQQQKADLEKTKAQTELYKNKIPLTEEDALIKREQAAANLEKTKMGTEKLKLEVKKLVEGGVKSITPGQAINILSDVMKGEHLKENYPEFYSQLEEIARGSLGGESSQQPGALTSEQEKNVQDNMSFYKKSREEIVAAMKKKGLL